MFPLVFFHTFHKRIFPKYAQCPQLLSVTVRNFGKSLNPYCSARIKTSICLSQERNLWCYNLWSSETLIVPSGKWLYHNLFCWCYNWHIKDSIDVNNSFTWFCTGVRYNWQPIFIIFKKAFIKTSASGVRRITEAYVLLACLTWNTICESASLWLLSSSGISIQPILIWNLISTA